MFQPKLSSQSFSVVATLSIWFLEIDSLAVQFFYKTAKSSRSQAEQEATEATRPSGASTGKTDAQPREVWLFFATKLAYNKVAEEARACSSVG